MEKRTWVVEEEHLELGKVCYVLKDNEGCEVYRRQYPGPWLSPEEAEQMLQLLAAGSYLEDRVRTAFQEASRLYALSPSDWRAVKRQLSDYLGHRASDALIPSPEAT